MKVFIVTQARVGSTRLPGKVLKDIGGISLLSIHLKRIKRSAYSTFIKVATTFEPNVEKIIAIAKEESVQFFQGDTNDVLNRFYGAVKDELPDYVVRLTSDCPLIDPSIIDACINICVTKQAYYVCTSEGFPDGLDVEVFPFKLLKEANKKSTKHYEREHVTPWIREYAKMNAGYYEYQNVPGYSGIRITVDEQTDFETIKKLVTLFGIDKSWLVYADYILSNSESFHNQHIQRNEGLLKSISNKNNPIL